MEELRINPKQVRKILVDFIRDTLAKSGFRRGVLGLSGGLDSTVVAYLASEALGPENVFGLIMPYKGYHSDGVRRALTIAKVLGINTEVIKIAPMVDEYFRKYSYIRMGKSCLLRREGTHLGSLDRIRKGNKMARERMSILYDWALSLKALVVGTSNRTELMLGYFTKYGDGGVDLEPLGDLYKTQVRQLAVFLGVPPDIISSVPTAGLWPGQTDEGELGMSYTELDSILYCLLDKKQKIETIVGLGFPREKILKVKRLIANSCHKRRVPPFPRIR